MPILVLLFIAVPIAELYVIIKVGEWIGILPTLAILIADALLGSLLLRQQGRAAWRRFNAAIAEGRFPGREAADGVMVAVGGTLLLTPGFITDVAGLVLLLPPSRALIRAGLFRYLRRRFVLVGGTGGAPGRGPGQTTGARYDYEGSAREVSPEEEIERQPSPDGPEHPHLPPS
jgi:UPF0716 protein FxsA